MRTRLGLKALGLCALVMGVMAIGTAGVAQAETGACWGYINASTGKLECFSSTLKAEVNLEVEGTGGTLLVEGLPEINCKSAALSEGKLIENGSISSGKVKFTKCLAYKNGSKLGTLLPSCKPVNEEVVTESGHGLIKLHELSGGVKDDTVLLLPDTGEILAVIHLNPECATGEEIIVKGHLVIWDCLGNASFLEHKTTHLIEEFPGLHLMHVGVKTAILDGSANATLKSPHNLLKWAGKPI